MSEQTRLRLREAELRLRLKGVLGAGGLTMGCDHTGQLAQVFASRVVLTGERAYVYKDSIYEAGSRFPSVLNLFSSLP